MVYKPQKPQWPELNIAQLNMRRSQNVSLEIRKEMDTKLIDVLLMQEPYNPRGKFIGLESRAPVVSGAEAGSPAYASIYIKNPHLTILKITHLSNSHCTCIQITGPFGIVYIASMYFQCSHSIDPYLAHLRKIVAQLPGQRLIIGADANAKSPLWHSPESDDRGEALEEIISELNLTVMNEPGNPPTFRSHNGQSRIDVTLASEQALRFIKNWRVMEKWTTSDHNVITFSFSSEHNPGYVMQTPRFNTRKADWDKYQAALTREKESHLLDLRLETAEDVSAAVSAMQTAIITACDAAMKKKQSHNKSIPWWTEELTILKRESYKSRKIYQRERDPELRNFKMQTYFRIKRKYTTMVNKTKKSSWRNYVDEEGNNNPWGIIYRLRMGKITPDKALASTTEEQEGFATWDSTALNLLNALVPDDTEDTAR